MAKNLEELKINPKLLETQGYRSFKDPRQTSNPWYVSSYQKRFDDEHGKMYFINFSFSDKSLGNITHNLPEEFRFSWEADLQLNTLEGLTINLSLFGDDSYALKNVEALCLSMFRKMNFEYYEYGWSGLTKEKHTLIAKEALTKEKAEKEKEFLEENLARLNGQTLEALQKDLGIKPKKTKTKKLIKKTEETKQKFKL